VLKLI